MTLRNAAIAGLCALASASAAWALTPEEVFRRASPAVWTVKSDMGNGKFGVGSAVAVTPQALVTACHVVDGAIGVVVNQGQVAIKVSQVLRDPDATRDLCVLTTDQRFPLPAVGIAPIDGVKVGQRVYAIGSPQGLELTLSEGLVSALRPKEPGQLPIVQTSAPISAGSSGGGLFDTEARLVGVADNISPGGANLGFAYPAQWVMELPQRVTAERARWRELLQSLGVVLTPNGEASPSGTTGLSDLNALPKVGNAAPEAVSNAYKQFLLQARPRAFLITSDGKFGAATGSAALLEHVKGCTERKVTCAVYAVDNAVVWGKQQPAASAAAK
ncbi:MAG: serine protease [Variovorax sp.]|nr:MAG: serine protease [Variovorax sp.]